MIMRETVKRAIEHGLMMCLRRPCTPRTVRINATIFLPESTAALPACGASPDFSSSCSFCSRPRARRCRAWARTRRHTRERSGSSPCASSHRRASRGRQNSAPTGRAPTGARTPKSTHAMPSTRAAPRSVFACLPCGASDPRLMCARSVIYVSATAELARTSGVACARWMTLCKSSTCATSRSPSRSR